MTATSTTDTSSANPAAPTTTCTTDTTTPSIETACPVDRDWIKKLLYKYSTNPNNGKALVVAPMVDQSDYPYRLLTRQYGANVTFTPMMNAGLLVSSTSYQNKFIPHFQSQSQEDRPCIGQLAGHDPYILEHAAKLILPYVDAIDINCGCPQGIAKRGFYGAYLLEQEDILIKCVKHLVKTISKPITVKVRIVPNPNYTNNTKADEEMSMKLYHKLVNCGIHLLTIHGRTRHQLHIHTGSADWKIIKRAVNEFSSRIPIFANGNIGSMDDVHKCFEETGVDGVMSSEAVLEYPAFFASNTIPRIGRCQLAREYLLLAKKYPPELGNQGSGQRCLKAHIHKMIHPDLEAPIGSPHELRRRVADSETWQDLWDIVNDIEKQQQLLYHKIENETLSWYMRHRYVVTDANGNHMSAIEYKRLIDEGIIQPTTKVDIDYNGKDTPEDDDPEKVAAYQIFDGNDDDDGDY